MNQFYTLPKGAQWIFAIIMALLFISNMLCYISLVGNNPLWFFLLILLAPLIQFLSTPIFTLIHQYEYLSPMLLVFGSGKEKLDLHNGTSFDYQMVMRNVNSGISWRSKMLSYYIQGILVIIEKIEHGEIHETIIVRGSSYFFSQKSVERMGPELHKTGLGEIFNSILNIMDITWMYSLAMGRLRVPNAFKVNTASISGEKLVNRKGQLQILYNYLNKAANKTVDDKY